MGSGEALNEEASTGSWPKWPERSERLIEATDIIRRMWGGQQISHEGKYYKVNAKLYDRPAKAIPLLMAANGPKAMIKCNGSGTTMNNSIARSRRGKKINKTCRAF